MALSDGCAALLVAVVGVLITIGEPAGAAGSAGMVLVGLPLLVRRYSVGLASAGFIGAGVWLVGLLFGSEVRCAAQLTAMAYLAFWAGRSFDRGQLRRWWWLAPLFVWGAHRYDPVVSGGGLVLAVLMLAGSVAVGLAVRGVDRRARRLDAAVELLRRERTHTAGLAAAAERLRIHDRLHAAVDARFAEILRLVGPDDRSTVSDRLAAVQDTAGTALERLRSMLLDLRAPTASPPPAARLAAPPPGETPSRRGRARSGPAAIGPAAIGLAAIAAFCAFELVYLLVDAGAEGSLVSLPLRHRVSIGVATAVLVLTAVVARRRPVAAVVVQSVVGPALVITGPQVDYLPTTCLLALAVVSYRAASGTPRRPALGCLAALLVSWGVAEFVFGAGLPVPGYAVLGPWLAGRAMRASRRGRDDLQAVHQELQAERGRQVELATQVERRHLVGEVHDVLGGALSVVLVQAAGARRVAGTDPGAAVGAAAAITETVLHARRQVAALRAGPGPGAPSGTTTHSAGGSGPDTAGDTVGDTAGETAGDTVGDTVEGVVRRMERAGMAIRLVGAVPIGTLPDDVAFVLARLVLESLTNALRHAHGAPVTVELQAPGGSRSGSGQTGGGATGEVVVVVTNGAAPAGAGAPAGGGTGLGLAAMAERVSALGGELACGPVDGGWAVRARIPYMAAALVTSPV